MTLACPNARQIYLAPLDKGLSGASVWLARWSISGASSKLHVFKIGDYKKLERERNAAATIAAPLEQRFPDMELCPASPARRGLLAQVGLLRQEFLGDTSGDVVNLRRWIGQRARNADEVRTMIRTLYANRMRSWHPPDGSFPAARITLEAATDRWGSATLRGPASQIGKRELDASLSQLTTADLASISKVCALLRKRKEEVAIGPVHGDLHSQNILVANGRLELIDFALTGEKWRALDFLMLECSLKFLVSPAHARLRDLLEIDEVAEPALQRKTPRLASLRSRLLGRELEKIAAGVAEVRRQALLTGAVTDGDQYRRGLVLMTAGLADLPEPINRLFLFHSLGWQTMRVR